MIFLVEEYPYLSSFLERAIGYKKNTFQSESGFNTEKTTGGVKINGVGYCFYNSQAVFVLPKVFLCDENKVLGISISANGEDTLGGQGVKQDSHLDDVQRRFLSSLSFRLFHAIDKYRSKKNKNNGVVFSPRNECCKSIKDGRNATLIDIVCSMKLFYKNNQNLFSFVAKNKSCGNHKINWPRTINRKIPLIQNDAPFYTDLISKAKVFDSNDYLLVLYFSAMKYIQDEYHQKMPESIFFQPLKKNEIERLMENERGLRELKKIKHKYFDDRFQKLYNILETFFWWGARFKKKNNKVQEYLIANSFNNVFEAMIDDLISDHVPDIEKKKLNKDGKIIDHLYKDESLIFASDDSKIKNSIWHIGDSKYYTDPEDIREKSIAKQYTYAKNMMQDFFSPAYFKNKSKHDNPSDAHYGIRYQDELTEGYNVTPNFFIRGVVPNYDSDAISDYQYTDPYFCAKKEDWKTLIKEIEDSDKFDDGEGNKSKNIKKHLWENRNRHFKNRLFDRDTLLLQIYNVNFLYVLETYTSNQFAQKKKIKNDIRKKFHNNFLKLLNDKYVFWAVWPQSGLSEKDFVENHFRTLLGKIFKPEGMKCFIIALEYDLIKGKNQKENGEELWKEIEPDCSMVLRVTPYDIYGESLENQNDVAFPHAIFDSKECGFRVQKSKIKKVRHCNQNTNSQVLATMKSLEKSGISFEEWDDKRLKQHGIYPSKKTPRKATGCKK